jgi:hypothetical protein
VGAGIGAEGKKDPCCPTNASQRIYNHASVGNVGSPSPPGNRCIEAVFLGIILEFSQGESFGASVVMYWYGEEVVLLRGRFSRPPMKRPVPPPCSPSVQYTLYSIGSQTNIWFHCRHGKFSQGGHVRRDAGLRPWSRSEQERRIPRGQLTPKRF